MTMRFVTFLVLADVSLLCHGRRPLASYGHLQHAPRVDDEIPPRSETSARRLSDGSSLATMLLAVNSMHSVGNRELASQLRKRGRSVSVPVAMKEQAKFTLPFFQKGVPRSQQPVVELERIRSQPFYDWAETDGRLGANLLKLYTGIMLLLSLPVSYSIYHFLPKELPNLLVAANIFTFPPMLLFVLRLLFGWGYVSRRLNDQLTYVEKESTGFNIRKDSETILRDRLIAKEEVDPIVRRSSFASLSVLGLSLAALQAEKVLVDLQGEDGVYTLKTFQGDDAKSLINEYKRNDNFANEQARRARLRSNKPVYCDSFYNNLLVRRNGPTDC